ncbi:MAG: DUF1576 domain-containing protein [Tenericutes bacterium]|nr:DUF1576 domain-containing protein [Mycoplasmatota bacterium]
MLKKLKENMLVPYLALVFLILAFVFAKPNELMSGMGMILTSPSVLLTDYIALAGLGATLLNSGILVMFSYGIVRITKIPITGPVFAGLLTIAGFSFFGMNILNSSIIFFGVFLYSKYKEMHFRSVIVILLFSAGLAPIASVIMFGLGLQLLIGIPLGVLVGVSSGFILMELAPHVIKFHNGYDLYNVGFAGGIIALLAYSVIKLTNHSYEVEAVFTTDRHLELLIIALAITITAMIVGFIANGNSLKEYKNILRKSGRAITDFTRKNREGIALFNSGLTGFLIIAIILALGIKLSGPSFGAILTVVGFGCFGKHPRNIIPGVFGVVLSALIFNLEFDSILVTLALIFSTTLAPISGEYGIIPGVIAGMLHLPVINNLGSLHGGIILYSNGFAAAFTAVLIHMAITAFERSDKKWQFMKLKKTSK